MTTRSKEPKKPEGFAAGVGRGLRLAEKLARKVARMHGTPVYNLSEDVLIASNRPTLAAARRNSAHLFENPIK
jgi:hypothetical protein